MSGQLHNEIHRSFFLKPSGHLSPLTDDIDNDCLLSDRALNYGEGLFETFAVVGSSAPLWQWHRERLLSACLRVLFPLQISHLERLENEIVTFIHQFFDRQTAEKYDAIGKLVITGGNQGRGYYPSTQSGLFANISMRPQAPRDLNKERRGIGLQICRQRISPQAALAGLKHTSRMEYCLAAKELLGRDDVEGLLLSSNGYLVETLHHNIFIVKDKKIITPELYDIGVRGIARRIIINDIAPALGFSVQCKKISENELFEADEVFVSNAVRGIWPVVSLNSQDLEPGNSDVTFSIQKQFNRKLNQPLSEKFT